MTEILEFRMELPFGLNDDDIDRLRELGEVRMTYVIECASRKEAVKDISGAFMGWRSDLGDDVWVNQQLGRGKRIYP